MKFKRNARKLSMIFALLTIFSLSANTTVLADGAATPLVEPSWWSRNYVDITIVFPNNINGAFAGRLGGATYIDCGMVDSNTLDCQGPFNWGSGPVLLVIYQNASPYNVVLTSLVYMPLNQWLPDSHRPHIR